MRVRLLPFLALLSLLSRPILAKQKILLYSRTAGFRHDSIPDAIDALETIAKKNHIDTVATENPKLFENKKWVNQFDALVFVSVSGQALTKKGEVNMMKYIEDGGGYFGIHEACDALYHSPWYGRLVGGYFNYHPYMQEFTLDVETHNHPSTSFLNKTWTVVDEVYSFNSDPRKLDKTVVLTADPTTWKDPGGESIKELAEVEGSQHPIAWYKEGDQLDQPRSKVGGGVDDNKHTPKNLRGRGGDGRSYYTALGHTKECWSDDTFIQHIRGALQWVLDSPAIRSNNASLPDDAPGTDPTSNETVKSNSNNSSISSSTSSSSDSGPTPIGPNSNSLLHTSSGAISLSYFSSMSIATLALSLLLALIL